MRASIGRGRRTLVLLLAFVGWGTIMGSVGDEADAAPLQAGRLVIALSTEPPNLDPSRAIEFAHHNVSFALYDTLVRLDAQMRATPGLATAWRPLSPTTWQFTLRRGVKFHNGEAFDGQAVKFSIEFMKRKSSRYATRLRNITAAEVVSPDTVNIITAEPDPVLPKRLAVGWTAMVPPGYVQKVGEDGLGQKPVGTGPFRFVEFVKGERIVLERNAQYFAGPPKLEQVVYRVVPDAAARAAALRAGDVDITMRLLPVQLDELRRDPNLQVQSVPGMRTYYVALPNWKPEAPWAHKKVRQALNQGVDIDAIIQHVLLGAARPASAVYGPESFGYDGSVPRPRYDPARARQLLGEAGYPNGFTAELSVTPGAYPFAKEAAEAIAGQLQQIGVTINVRPREQAVQAQDWVDHRLELFYEGQVSHFADADLPLRTFFRSGQTYLFFADEQLEKLIDRAAVELDEKVRLRLYAQLQRELVELAPVIFLYQLEDIYGSRRRVHGFQPKPNEIIDLLPISTR